MVVLTFPVSGFFLGGGEIQISLKCIHNIPTLLGNNTTELGLLSWFDFGLILLLIIKINKLDKMPN